MDLGHQDLADQEDFQDHQVHQEELVDQVLEDQLDQPDDQDPVEKLDLQVLFFCETVKKILRKFCKGQRLGFWGIFSVQFPIQSRAAVRY